MHRFFPLIAIALSLRFVTAASAEIIINPPRPITHEVTVQIIQTALDNGSSPAAVFGNPTREAAIKSVIDTIWSQAGIDINFLPNVVRYNNSFAYQGSGLPSIVRPITDLELIMTGAELHGGIVHPDPSVINMFFVNVVPGFDLKTANWANGVGNIGHNGIAMFIGASVSAEHAGHWMSHEIAHNLGLRHASAGSQNLMTSSRNTERLTADQIGAIFQTQSREDEIAFIPQGGTGFPQVLSTAPGDYDGNGEVDALDYVFWRKATAPGSVLVADGNGDGRTDAADYAVWKSHFADSSGEAAATSVASLVADAGVPEPASLVLIVGGAAVTALAISRRRAQS
jgi:hypothetical protein